MMLLTLCLSFAFTSCNDDIKDFTPDEETLAVTAANVAGTWKYQYYDYTDVADDYVIMQLNADGTMTTTYYNNENVAKTQTDGTPAIVTGQWSLNGNTITMSNADGTSTATVKWVTATTLYIVLSVDPTTNQKDVLMAYTKQ